MPCRFEDDKHVSGLFEELWEENTSSERIALQLYLAEIVSLVCESITSSSWSSKKKVNHMCFSHSFFPFIFSFFNCFISALPCIIIYLIAFPKKKNIFNIFLHIYQVVDSLYEFYLEFQSGLAICKLGEVLGESLASHHRVLLEAVLKDIPGRLWEVRFSFFMLVNVFIHLTLSRA